jgi:cytochrome c oxidase subunit 2
MLEPGGPQASHIADLWTIMLWVGVVVTIAIVVFEAYAVTRGLQRHRAEGDAPPIVDEVPGDRWRHAVIVGATALTVLTLVTLLFISVGTGRALAALPSDEGLRIKVTAHQWWWQVEYQDPVPARHAITANEIHVPVGRTIHLELTAGDVIHSFWIPGLHGKKDLIPGRINRTSLRVDRPGRYGGQCAEFCGLQHAKMAIEIVAEPPEVFDAWLEQQRAPAAIPQSDLQLHGRDVFIRSTCSMCHAITGTPAGAGLGPDLTHLASRAWIGAGTLTNTRDHLGEWIRDPQRFKPGVRMPATPLDDQDLSMLLDYLESLR